MAINPKNIQGAVKLAVALANPVLKEGDWYIIKERFHLDDELTAAVRELIEISKKNPAFKAVLASLTH